jgi:hypothetical protein
MEMAYVRANLKCFGSGYIGQLMAAARKTIEKLEAD